MENDALIRSLRSDLGIEIIEKDSYEKIHTQLAAYLNELVKNDFDKLLAWLYRIDVYEEKLKVLLQQHPQEDAGNIMATLIIERQLEKIKTREQFGPGDSNPPACPPYDSGRRAGQAGIDELEKW